MPRAGTAARRREREGRSPAKPGKVGWVHGTKLPFFQAHKDEFLAATEIKGTGAFYEKIAHLYLAKYGYNLDWHEDLHSDQDVADDVDPTEDVNSLDPEEAERRNMFFKKLKQVRDSGSVPENELLTADVPENRLLVQHPIRWICGEKEVQDIIQGPLRQA
jgi:hypothetical protein